MRTKILFAGVLAVTVLATAGVIATQQSPMSHGPAAIGGPVFQLVHSGCNQKQSHVPPHLAAVLAMTEAQVADMNAIAADACTTMEQIHHRMSNVLTAEQHEKARSLHGEGQGHPGAAWFRKLHGG